ncbi:hypothetical protein ACFQ3P_19195 [Paraburkholderia sabiae]|uniref:DUF3618 domain-containing protein n=1 Tax=Paraburkholderia sabiae TaxID=273251 RepID=A0ABU9QB56_9BURK|nr:hypothetical protein [Paraburkholderia sabiae]WJZ72426.1 hypothetical protein QEN71_19925 [Paraburkholderia sabiae]CAD6536864.1 hypothetical protein LMG24235_03148 [Paraburkholderia sabiae]
MKQHDIARRALPVTEREALVRAQLAASRADLLVKALALREGRARRVPPWPVRGIELVSVAPNVTLLTAVAVCALVVGPRKIASVVVRNGIVGWVGKNVRRRAAQ